MALGFFLRFSWILLLFGGSAGSPAMKGYGYPYAFDSRNIGHWEDEALTSPTFDQSTWQASNNQPGPVYTSYNKPTVVQQSDWAPTQQNLPNTPSGPEVERLVNGVSRDWGLESPNKPLVFPLLSDPAKPHASPVQPQSSIYGVANSVPASQSAGGSTYHAPSTTSQDLKPPSFVSWHPEPNRSGYGVVDFNTDSSAAQGNLPHLVYEDVFKYPSEKTQSQGAIANTQGGYSQANYEHKGSSTGSASTLEGPSFPSYPANTGARPVYPSRLGRFPGGVNFNFRQTDNQPRDDKVSRHAQKPVHTQKVEVSQRVSEPILPPAPPPSYIIQSRNDYQRARYLESQSRYTPEFLPLSSNGVKGPAPTQPAAPKGVKNPGRTKW